MWLTKIQCHLIFWKNTPISFWITFFYDFFHFFLKNQGEDHFSSRFSPTWRSFSSFPPWVSAPKDLPQFQTQRLGPAVRKIISCLHQGPGRLPVNTHVTYLLFKTGCFRLDTSRKGGFSNFWTINSGGLGCVLYLNYLELQWLWDLMSCWVWCAVVSKKAQMVCRVFAIKLDEFCFPPKSKFKTVRIPAWDSWAISCENQCSTYFMLLESQ